MENHGDNHDLKKNEHLKDVEVIEKPEREKENEKENLWDMGEENKDKDPEKKDDNKGDKKGEKKKGKEKKEDKKEDKNKDKKEEINADDKKNKNKGKEFYLYFIQANCSDSLFNIELEKNKQAEDLKKVRVDLLNNDLDGAYIIYQLKIMPNLGIKDLTLKFKLTGDNEINYNAEIKLKDFSHDCFFYDFKYEPVKKKKNDIQIDNYAIKLNHYQQFKIFYNYIEDGFNKKKKDSLFAALFKSTKNLLILKEKNNEKNKQVEYYDFSLFLTFFSYSYENSIFLDLLKEFELKYLEIKYMALDLNHLDIEKIKERFNKIEENTENIFKELENLDDKIKYKANLYFIILVFRQFYEKENFQKTLNNFIINEDTHRRIYRGIIRFPDLFIGARFEKEQISKMIEFCDNYKGIKKSLKYITNINDYLDIILKNFEIIAKLRDDDMKKDKNKKPDEFYLDISRDLIKETDNIQKICENYEKIMDKQKEKKIDKFIIFGSKLFDKYMKYYELKDLGNLYTLMNLIKKIIKKLNEKALLNPKPQNKNKDKKDPDDDFLQKYKESKHKLGDIIRQTGFQLALTGALTNIEILDFIKKEKDYIKHCSKANKDEVIYFSTIFKGLHIDHINEEFLKEWKKFDWHDYFGDEENYVYKNIFECILNFHEFGMLMKLLNTSKNEKEFKFTSDLLGKLIEKFIDIYQKNMKYHEDNYQNYLIELIYQSDLDNNIDSEKLLNLIHSNMNFEKVKSIYIDLCFKYGNKLSDSTKNTIVLYIFQNSEDEEHIVLIKFAENFEFLRKNIFQIIKEFELKTEDFWELEENFRIKLFRGLLEKADINNALYQKIEYIENSLKVIEDLKKEFDKNEVDYPHIINFFQNNELVGLKKKILLIYLNNETKANKKYNEILEKKKLIDNVLEDLDLIYNDLNIFLYISQKKTMEQIDSIKTEITQGPLNHYENNCSKQYQKLIKEFKNKAEERKKKNESLFFRALFNENKKNKKFNDVQWTQNTEEQFEKLKPIFIEINFRKVEKKVITICLNEIKSKSNEEITNEIDKLINIFEIQNKNIDKNKIVEKMKLLARSEDIRNASIYISTFVQYTQAIETTEFKNSIEKIIKTLQDSFNEDDIKYGQNVLKKVNVDIDILYEKEIKIKNNYLKILQLLDENKESITFLIKRTLEDCQTLKELVGEVESGFLTINHIIDLEKCVEFMNSLGTEEKLKTIQDSELIKLFVQKTIESEEILVERFTSYSNNFLEIKNLFDSRLDKSEASRQKIQYILKESIFTLKSERNESFEGKYFVHFSKEEGDIVKEEKINIDQLLELRDRAQLAKKITGDKNEMDILEKNKQFIQIISEINNILI